MTTNKLNGRGKVYLVGAGPGDPGLISLRGVECLREADVVLYDYLVNPQIIGNCTTQCEKISLGSHATGRLLNQQEINQQLVELAMAGKKVVRLKSGDPAVFGRLAEELGALRSSEISFEIVPGITAGFAASSLAGLPITNRDSASAVALVTGQEKTGKQYSAIDFRALADFPGTLVIYMGTTTVEHWSRQLIAAGKPASTPVLIVRRCSFPDQKTICSTLGEVAKAINLPSKVRPPVVFVVGQVASPENVQSWFECRPLFGQTVLLCRAEHQSMEGRRIFEEKGARVLIQPAIEIAAPDNWSNVDAAIETLDDFNWIVFSSSNGVDFFFSRLRELGKDARAFGGKKIAVVGERSAARLKSHGIVADVVPEEFRAESLADELSDQASGNHFLLVRGSRGRDILKARLETDGATVTQIVAYQSLDVAQTDPKIVESLEQGEIDWVIASSSAISRSIVRLFGETLGQAKVASISPITSEALRRSGIEPGCEATDYTLQGIAEAIVENVPVKPES